EAELRRAVRARVPEYMAPEEIVMLEEMPLTENGKIDRKRLEEMGQEGASREKEAEAARTGGEGEGVGIFEEALKREGVGRRENFFELGGHSLLATQVVTRVRGAFGVEMGVGSVFEEGTAEGLGRRIEDLMRAGERRDEPALERVERGARLP